MVNAPHCLLLLPRKGKIHVMDANLLLINRVALAYSNSETTEQVCSASIELTALLCGTHLRLSNATCSCSSAISASLSASAASS